MMMAAPLTRDPGLSCVARVDVGLVPRAAGEESRVAAPASAVRRATAGRAFSVNLAPPPTASTDTASTTICLVRSMKPKRALCAFSNARFIDGARCRPATTSAVSVPA